MILDVARIVYIMSIHNYIAAVNRMNQLAEDVALSRSIEIKNNLGNYFIHSSVAPMRSVRY
jgi:DNA-binding phage protein